MPLTSGDWEVVNRQVWWDESHQVVYFHALKDSCLEKHLYCVSVNRPGEVRILEQILFGSDLSSISAKLETDIREIKEHSKLD